MELAQLFRMSEKELVNYICGHEIPMGGISEQLTLFTGNQHNEQWSWNRNYLKSLSHGELMLLAKQVERI